LAFFAIINHEAVNNALRKGVIAMDLAKITSHGPFTSLVYWKRRRIRKIS